MMILLAETRSRRLGIARGLWTFYASAGWLPQEYAAEVESVGGGRLSLRSQDDQIWDRRLGELLAFRRKSGTAR